MSTEPCQYLRPNSQTFQLVIKRFAPWKYFGVEFDGDHRTFSTSKEATYRTGAFIDFDLEPGRLNGRPSANSSGSRARDRVWENNRVLRNKVFYAKVKIELTDLKGREGAIHFLVTFAGNNPLVPGSPDINTRIFFAAFMQPDGLYVNGLLSGDPFPNAEVFLRDNAGNGHLLLTYATPHDQDAGPMQRLWGSNEKNIIGSFQTTIPLTASWQFKKAKQLGYLVSPTAAVLRRVT